MLKKLILMAVSVAAFAAFAAPAAQASGALITTNEGTAATSITAESGNTTTVTANGTLECATVKLSGGIATNANTTAQGSGSGTANGTMGVEPHTDHCATDSGIKVHILDISLDSIHLERDGGETAGTAEFTYTYQLTTIFGTAHCGFASGEDEAGNSEVTVTRTGTSSINANGRLVKTEGGFLCAEEGALNGDFTVRAQNGELAVIH